MKNSKEIYLYGHQKSLKKISLNKINQKKYFTNNIKNIDIKDLGKKSINNFKNNTPQGAASPSGLIKKESKKRILKPVVQNSAGKDIKLVKKKLFNRSSQKITPEMEHSGKELKKLTKMFSFTSITALAVTGNLASYQRQVSKLYMGTMGIDPKDLMPKELAELFPEGMQQDNGEFKFETKKESGTMQYVLNQLNPIKDEINSVFDEIPGSVYRPHMANEEYSPGKNTENTKKNTENTKKNTGEPKSRDSFDNQKTNIHKNYIWNQQKVTPLVNLSSVTKNKNVNIFGKCEFMNPSGSIKDRIAMHMLSKAEQSGKLKPGMTIVAASSGNTAPAVAMWAKTRGYKALLITNTKCSKEKMDSIKAYDGELMVTKSGLPADDPEHYQNVELRLAKEEPEKYFSVNQYDNLDNQETYYKYFGPEIWEQVDGKIDYFVAAASTGGTVSGTGRFLKEKNPDIKVILPDPEGSIFYKYQNTGKLVKPGKFLVEGVGKDSIPKCFKSSVIDDSIVVKDEDSFSMCHYLAHKEGLLVGGSSGTNVHACKVIADSLPDDGKKYTIITPLVDSGLKYLSKVFNKEFLKKNGVEIKDIYN